MDLSTLSDIVLACSISCACVAFLYFTYKHRYFFPFALFAVFYLLHSAVLIWSQWSPESTLVVTAKVVTAALATASLVVLGRYMPMILAIKSPKEVDAMIAQQADEAERINNRYRALVGVMTEVVWTKDPNGNFHERQGSWEDYTGQKWEQYRGKGWIDAVHPDDRRQVAETLDLAISTLSEYHTSKRLWHQRTGSYRYCEARAVPLFDAGGEIIEWVGMIADIHDRRMAEERLRQEADNKDAFLAMLAHELRNPLAPILNCATILGRESDVEILTYARDTISRQVAHLTRLVDDLLDVSRIMRGKVELKSKSTDLTEILFRALETSKPYIEGAYNHRFLMRLPENDQRFMADDVRVGQIVSNLLNNAGKYTLPGGVINLWGEIEGGQIIVKVRDTGIGIEEKHKGQIFQPFFQADRSLDRSKGGLGIGLALVKSLVEMHKGHISFTSELGRGSEFIVRIPLPETIMVERIETQGAALETTAPKGKRILIVEDNVDAAKSLSYMLRYDGHQSMYVLSGPSALEACEQFKPEIVLLDIGLPGMNGYEVAKALRASGSCQKAIIIAMTGYGTEEHKVQSQEAGINEHLVKPVSEATLKETFAKYV